MADEELLDDLTFDKNPKSPWEKDDWAQKKAEFKS